jgi:DNA polymerase-1
MGAPQPLLIADVPWLLYRSFFALPQSIVDRDGRPLNALLGTVNALLSAAAACGPRAVAACTGAEEAVYRVALYPGYHAHRDAMPPALREQWNLAPELLAGLGWTVTGSEELEADDVMFSYAQVEAQAGGRALLLTRDRDLYAAVGERVAVLELSANGKASEVGPAQVRERYGIGPELVSDFIALRGDPSDGLPGAPGIGAKTAAELLREFGSLEELLRAAGSLCGEPEPRRGQGDTQRRASDAVRELRPRIASALHENAALLGVFKQVATLQRIALERPRDGATDYNAGARHARALGMNVLARRLEEAAQTANHKGG